MTSTPSPLASFLFGGIFYTIGDLPPHNENRWTPRKKALLVLALEHSLLTEAAVLEKYHLESADVGRWRDNYRTHGVAGLRITKRKRQTDDKK